MTTKQSPKVSFGMPVYNGQRYLAQAIESLLSQTFTDFEIVISDNMSTDQTHEICTEYARRDTRVRYTRNESNIGPVKNFNRVFELARGRYFRWAAADDFIAPDCLAKCVDVLDAQPSVLICHTGVRIVDAHGDLMNLYDDQLHFMDEQAHRRFFRYLFRSAGMWNAIYGLMRSETLRQSPRLQSFIGSDKVLLGDLVLRGKLYRVAEPLLSRREHEERAHGVYGRPNNLQTHAEWIDPDNRKKKVTPVKRKLFAEYMRVIKRSPITPAEKSLCFLYVLKWGTRKVLLADIKRMLRPAQIHSL